MFTPSASRQSAVPHSEDAARFPCLPTFIPPAAATSADVVEMLKLCALSPPVPTISNSSIPVSTRVACARIAAAQPAISSVVSALALFVESAARNAAFCVALVSPLMISFMTAYASSYVRSSLFTIFTMASLIMFLSSPAPRARPVIRSLRAASGWRRRDKKTPLTDYKSAKDEQLHSMITIRGATLHSRADPCAQRDTCISPA